jgi:hypothetical protein
MLIFKKHIASAHRLGWNLLVLLLAANAPAQPAGTGASAGASLEPPANDFLVLSNVTGQVRVLDSKGLVLEKNLSFLPRIPLADLSPAQLEALLETKTAYNILTSFGSLTATNAQGAVVEHQFHQIWGQGKSLAEQIQTRLEILEDMRDYNNEIALVPGSVTAANQYALNDIPINNRLTNQAAAVVAAGAQADTAERNLAPGDDASRLAEQQAREKYRQTVARVERADDRAMIANGQIVGANQVVTDHLAKCAALSARLASHGIIVAGAPPFYAIPPLTMNAEVDAKRSAN